MAEQQRKELRAHPPLSASPASWGSYRMPQALEAHLEARHGPGDVSPEPQGPQCV